MSRHNYVIDTTLRSEGTTYGVNYYPWSRGRKHWNAVTSFEQYKDELKDHLTSWDVCLYTISDSGESVHINDDSDLYKAVKRLPSGGKLAIIAIKSHGSDSGSDSPAPYGPYPNDAGDVMKRFDVHGYWKCFYDNNCDMKGPRYICTYNHKYSICYSCWKRLRSNKGIWKKCNEAGAPWDGEVPDAPLYRENCPPDRDDVRHLNYVLCRLGFISLDKFKRASSREFGRATDEGVTCFRKQYRIRGKDMGVYDEATEKKMEELVHRFRREGALFI